MRNGWRTAGSGRSFDRVARSPDNKLNSLGGSVDKKLLAVRVFDDKVKKTAYAKQTQAAETKGESNCPLCAIGHEAKKSRIYKFDEMDADHVDAWSKGGESSAKNCQMLCTTHNRAKGNR
jgi:hypothetical protein